MSGIMHDVRPRSGSLQTGARSAILGLLLLVGVFSTSSGAVQDFTCFSQKLYIGGSQNTIGGFKSGSDKGATVTIERGLDTGNGTDLPPGNGPRRHSVSVSAQIFTMYSGQISRFGAYNCKFDPVDVNQPEVQITTVIMADDAYIKPESPTKVAVVGESVTLTMTYPGSNQGNLRWKHDGNDKTDWDGEPARTIPTVQTTDAGIYECFEVSRRGEQKHGIMKLIVRECGLYNWNPPSSCDRACPACHNGGVCDDKTGECICAPGFSGDFCETLIGKNYFGQDCGIICSSSDPDTACRNNLMCLPDPFGCTCAASFTGSNCETDCPSGFFGAGCGQQCHCAAGICNFGHGRCSGECEDGFRGENCQNNCPIGQIGQIGVNCIDCTVPVVVKNPVITPSASQWAITWELASNMCPVSNYTVQFELINRDQCQPVSDTYLDVATTEAMLYALQVSDLDPSMFVPYSTYKIRVRARNEAGLGLYLTDVTNDEFISAEQAPSAPPDNVMHFNVTDVGAIFQWDKVPCGSRRGAITEYSYELTKSNEMFKSGEVTERIQSFNDLYPCSDYSFRVAAKTSGGDGVHSNETHFSTETKAHLPVENLGTSEREDTLEVTWDETDVTQNPCSLLYKIEYELINRDQCEPISSPVRSEGFNRTTPGITLDGLDAYSTYTVYVWTWNEAGLSEERSLNSTTAGKVPSEPPGNVTHLGVTDIGVSFQWDEVPCGSRGGDITEYSYELMTSSGNSNRSETTAVRSLSFNDLLPCTEYKFKVAAKTDLGTGNFSEEIVFTTSTKAHPPVENLATTEMEEVLEVTWDATDVTQNPCSLFYKIEYELINRDQCEPISSPVRSEGVNQTTPGITLDGLDAYSTYTVYVWTWSEAAGLSEERSLNSTTASKAPSAPPANIKHLNLTESGVSFQWDEVPCGSRGGNVTEYSYELMTSSVSVETATTSAKSLSFNNLLPCTDYKFKVAAMTSIGVGTYTEEVEFTTSTKAHFPVGSLSANGGVDMLLVTWDATDVTQNPCPLHYTVQYELINRDQCEPISSPVRSEGVDQTTPGITLDGLDAYSTYTVYVWTWNEAELSEERSTSNTTSSKAPDQPPTTFEMEDKTKNSISVSWSTVSCGDRNGEIIGYWMKYKILDKPYDKMFDPSLEEYIEKRLSDREKNVTGLEPSTQYDFQVAGLVRIGAEEVAGPYAGIKIYTAVETDIEKPEKPAVDTSLTTSSTVTIALSPPAVTTYVTNFQIGVLLITSSPVNTEGNIQRRDVSPDLYVAGEFSKDSLPDTFEVGDDRMYGGYRNKPLESSAMYEIYLGAVSKTSSEEAAIAWGDPSRVEVGSGDPEGSFPVVAVIIPILVIIVVGVVAGGLFLKRRGAQERDADSEGLQVAEVKEGKQRYTSTHSSKDNFAPIDEGVAMATTSLAHPASPEKPKARKRTFRAPTAIPLTEFEDFIKKKKAETYKEGNGFLLDYKNLPDEVLYPCSVAKEEKNKTKNRYANIIPYDDSRVVLDKLPDDPTSSDYVNASYIDGFNAPKRYIATQGPNKASVPDLWRMIWQENCTKIVMLTNLLEGIKGKCEQYWPDKTLSYGKISVKLVKEVKRVDYIIRDFILSHEAEEQRSRKVRQYHFTTWPDMGLPQDPSKVVDLVKIVKEYKPNDGSPMVVHCSAGVGRTGTFIILDAMLDQVKAEGKLDIWNFARGMRDRRMKMIQTSAQYEFVFDALLDEFQCGDKTIKSEELRSKLAALKNIQMPSHKTGIQLEFESLEKVSSSSTSSDQYRGGQDPDNIDKNRFPDIVPVDRLRPRLMTAGEAGSTDYVNASFLNSYSAKSGYITTQMPLPQTVGDLWRMAYDYSATCIVMLNSMNDKTFASYLPTKDEPTTVGPLSVTLESTDQLENGITMRSLKLTNQKMKEFRKIRQMQLSDWPDASGVPASPKSALQVVTAVHQWQKDHGNEDRILVHCIDGVRASGTFCALLNIMAKVNDGNVVDVYRAVMKIKGTRAGMVPSLEHYSFLYGAVQSHLDTDIVYENL